MIRFRTKSPMIKLTLMIVLSAVTAQLTMLPLNATPVQEIVPPDH